MFIVYFDFNFSTEKSAQRDNLFMILHGGKQYTYISEISFAC